MSYLFDKEVSGEQDFGTITSKELINIILDVGFTRINSMYCLWLCEKIDEDGFVSDSIEVSCSEASELEKQGYKVKQLNKWAFDVD